MASKTYTVTDPTGYNFRDDHFAESGSFDVGDPTAEETAQLDADVAAGKLSCG